MLTEKFAGSVRIALANNCSTGADPHHRCSVRGQPDDHSAYEALLDRHAGLGSGFGSGLGIGLGLVLRVTHGGVSPGRVTKAAHFSPQPSPLTRHAGAVPRVTQAAHFLPQPSPPTRHAGAVPVAGVVSHSVAPSSHDAAQVEASVEL